MAIIRFLRHTDWVRRELKYLLRQQVFILKIRTMIFDLKRDYKRKIGEILLEH